jgi:hypothetical protein
LIKVSGLICSGRRDRHLHVILLVDGSLVEGAINIIEKSKGTLCPDNEAAEVTTGSQLEEVKPPDVDKLDTGQVAEGLDDTIVFIVDNKWTTALAVPAVPQLALAGPEFAGVGDFDDISVGIQRLEEGNGFLCLLEGLSSRSDNKGNFLNLLDAVTASEDKGGKGGCSKSRDSGKAALVLVHFDVPLAPGLGGGEHASSAAHVSEGGLDIVLDFFFAMRCDPDYAPGQSDVYLHHQHGEYELRRDQYPRTLR